MGTRKILDINQFRETKHVFTIKEKKQIVKAPWQKQGE